MTSRLVVLEGRWEQRRNVSVKSLFDVLSDMHFGSPHAYHYSIFSGADAFQETVRHVCALWQGQRYLYVGAHGDPDNVWGAVWNNNDETVGRVSRTRLRNAVAGENALMGLFMGSCSFGREGNASFFFEGANLVWFAGYEESVDWVESSVLDTLFWSVLLGIQSDNYPNAPTAGQVMAIITATAARVWALAQGLCQELGFRVFACTQGGQMTQLIPPHQ